MNSDSAPILRKLTLLDLSHAVGLSTEAGWNQTEQDWRLLLELAPEGSLAIEVAGELASTATLICYGARLAWVGMVLTKTKFRGRGYAQRLLKELLALADRLGIESVKLDATEEGRPIYRKLGFRDEQAVERWERWERVATDTSIELVSTNESLLTEDMLQVDVQAFRADRSELLKRLSTRTSPYILTDSYLCTRSGRIRNYLGPFVASSPDHARILGERVALDCSWFWDLLTENREAVTLATDLGFASRRRLVRMVRGNDFRGDERLIYALGGFELG